MVCAPRPSHGGSGKVPSKQLELPALWLPEDNYQRIACFFWYPHIIIYSHMFFCDWLAVSENDLFPCSVPRQVEWSWAFQKGIFKTVGVPAPRRNLKSGLGLVVVCPETVVALWGIFLSASPTSMKQRQHREHVAVDYHSPVSEVGMASVDWWGWWWCFWWSLLM